MRAKTVGERKGDYFGLSLEREREREREGGGGAGREGGQQQSSSFCRRESAIWVR